MPNTTAIPTIYTLHFEKQDLSIPLRAKRYLLRLINTSFDSTFIFSIDNHWLQIVGADFVPIEPYKNTSVLIGIGQRYNVIVEAMPVGDSKINPVPKDNNFWIRTWVADSCGKKGSTPYYEQTGVLRYDERSTSDPTSLQWPNIAKACSDETYTSLKPILPWFVGNASNGGNGEEFDVTLNTASRPFPHGIFSLEPPSATGFTPLQVNYSDPIFLHLDNSGAWPRQWVVVPEDYTDTSWVSHGPACIRTRYLSSIQANSTLTMPVKVYLVVTGTGRSTTYGAHPVSKIDSPVGQQRI